MKTYQLTILLFMLLIVDACTFANALPATSDSDTASKWSVSKSISPMDDSVTVSLSLDANEEITAWPSKVARPTLIVRYREGKLDAYFNLGVTPNVESGDRRTVTLRFDQNEAFNVRGNISTSGEAIFLPDTRNIVRYIADSKILHIRFTPFNSNPVVASFDLQGFESKAEELLNHAGLSLDNKAELFEDTLKRINRSNEYSPVAMYTRVDGFEVSIRSQGSN